MGLKGIPGRKINHFLSRGEAASPTAIRRSSTLREKALPLGGRESRRRARLRRGIVNHKKRPIRLARLRGGEKKTVHALKNLGKLHLLRLNEKKKKREHGYRRAVYVGKRTQKYVHQDEAIYLYRKKKKREKVPST